MEEELKVIQLILTGSGSFSIAIAVSLLLLKRILKRKKNLFTAMVKPVLCTAISVC